MELKTCRYFLISNILLFLLLGWGLLNAQTVVTETTTDNNNNNTTPPVVFPLYNGTYVNVDLYGVGSKLLGGDFLSSEISIDVNLKNRFFPVLELGYGSTDAWNERGTRYKSSAPFFRVGMNYNTMYKKANENHLYVGVRYAMSSVSYDIQSTTLEDPLWGESIGNPNLDDPIWGGYLPQFDHKGLKATMHWFELVAGVRVKIYKDFLMGWSFRMKYRISSSPSQYGDPWYIPGFGTYDTSTMGITYSLIYKLPF